MIENNVVVRKLWNIVKEEQQRWNDVGEQEGQYDGGKEALTIIVCKWEMV